MLLIDNNSLPGVHIRMAVWYSKEHHRLFLGTHFFPYMSLRLDYFSGTITFNTEFDIQSDKHLT